MPLAPAPIAASAASGELDDFGAFFRRYASDVARIAARMLGRDAEVDDVVQEVFATALRRRRELASMPTVRQWLVSMTIKRVLTLLRWRRVRAAFGMREPPELDQIAAPAMAPERRFELVRLYRALEALPPGDRVAWVLRFVEGERLEDVGALCGCSLATAKRRIARAQSALDVALGVEGRE